MSRRRKPTLDEIEGGSLDDMPGPWNGESRVALWPRRHTPAPTLPTLGELGHCWCGEPHNHDWPGKADGAPHPR